MERKEWLAERKKGIGGSDIAVLLGINRFQTPVDLFLSKTTDIETEENNYMRAGKILEPAVAEWYGTETGEKLIVPDPMIVTDLVKPYFKASCDRYIEDNGVLEVKTTQMEKIDEMEFNNQYNPMKSWFCQGQWYLGVTGRERLVVSWLEHGLNFKFIEFNRDQNFIDLMRQLAEEFWLTYIEPKTPPPPMTSKDVINLYPKSTNGKTIEIGDGVYNDYKRLCKIQKDITKLDKEKKEIIEGLKAVSFDAEELTYQGKKIATYKSGKTSVVFDEDRFKSVSPTLYSSFLTEKQGGRTFRPIYEK